MFSGMRGIGTLHCGFKRVGKGNKRHRGTDVLGRVFDVRRNEPYNDGGPTGKARGMQEEKS